MTATAPHIDQVAPGIVTRIREGELSGARNLLLGVGVVGLLASIGGAFSDAKQFYHSYLIAYMFTLGIALGGLFFTLIHHVTRAGWSVVVRRIAENMAGVLPILALLFVPLIFGHHDLYHHWVDAVIVEGQPEYDGVIAGKSGWLNSTFFFIRAAIYFAIWILLARYFRAKSLEQDETGDAQTSLRMTRVAAPCLLLFALSITFAAFDWVMSLDPHWFSTMFGVTYFAGAVIAALATMGLLCMWLGTKGYLKEVINQEHYHDIGKLLFAFIVFWTYVNFSQYMLIWYANLPEETMWYEHRMHGWQYVGQVLIIGHFLVPFAFLMSRHMKRNTKTLAIGAVFMLVMHWFDMLYLVMPNHSHHVAFSWMDATTMIAMIGLFLAFTISNILRSPLVPQRDPRLKESLKFVNI